MSLYTIFLEEGLKSQVVLETDDFNEAEDILGKKWYEIEGKQILTLLGEGITSTRRAVKGNPLDKWESERMERLNTMKEDIARNGDATLLVRGLVVEFMKEGKKYVRVA